jgi:HD superfamily phosphohydrolase YqeK
MTPANVKRIVEGIAAGALVASAALIAFADVPTRQQWMAAAFFTTFGLLASVLGYRRTTGTSGTISFLPFLSVALLAPNVAALVTVLVSIALSEFIAKRALIKGIFNVAQYVLAQSLAIAAYLALGGNSVLEGWPPMLAFGGLFLAFTGVNKLAVSLVVSASSGASARDQWFASLRDSIVYDVLSLPLIVLFSFLYVQFGPGLAATFALPMLGIRQLYKQNVDLQKINEELLQLMVASIEARDPYTSGHSQRVSRYARVIARCAGVTGKLSDRTAIAALLHDVGKIHEEFAPILRKPGRLTEDEFEIMKSHSARSAELVGKVSQFADLVPAIRSHHEAWDGSGYPAQLRGADIPLVARIIALADTIDAMSTSRPYRPALSTEVVREEIRLQAGKQFDPAICATLLSAARWDELERAIAAANLEFPIDGHAHISVQHVLTPLLVSPAR